MELIFSKNALITHNIYNNKLGKLLIYEKRKYNRFFFYLKKFRHFFIKAKKLANLERLATCGCGGKTRTYDLRVMSPTSCQLLHPAICCFLLYILLIYMSIP